MSRKNQNASTITTLITPFAKVLNNPKDYSSKTLNHHLEYSLRYTPEAEKAFFKPKGLKADTKEGWLALKASVKDGSISEVLRIITPSEAKPQKKSNKPKSEPKAQTPAPAQAHTELSKAELIAKLVDLRVNGVLSKAEYIRSLEAL